MTRAQAKKELDRCLALLATPLDKPCDPKRKERTDNEIKNIRAGYTAHVALLKRMWDL